MASFAELARRIRKVSESKLQSKVEEIVLTDLEVREVKRQEFKSGERPDGTPIGRYKSPSYEAYKVLKNPQAGGMVDLIDTGKFTNQLFVKSKGNSKFLFESQDEKSQMLQDKYGSDIMGMNQDSFNELQRKKYADKLIRYIKQITRL